jgi:hypothetical protein
MNYVVSASSAVGTDALDGRELPSPPHVVGDGVVTSLLADDVVAIPNDCRTPVAEDVDMFRMFGAYRRAA